MQVTHQKDYATHVVIGGKQAISMGISDDPAFFQVLSSSLYTDKILAVVRETLCNAYDAHKMVGIEKETPVEITLKDDEFVIRDFGPGIHPDDVGTIYGVYGGSTKKHDGTQTGGFGLGCKSPFAYVDNFQVTIHHEGKTNVYRMQKASIQNGGRPAITPVVTDIPTDQTGLEVRINIKSEDVRRFATLIRRIVANAEMLANFNGVKLPTLPFSQVTKDWSIATEQVLEYNGHIICVRYGDVIYPVERDEFIAEVYDPVHKFVNSLPGNVNVLVLQAKPNSVSITPSREALSMEDHTRKTLLQLLNKFLRATRNINKERSDILAKSCEELVQARAGSMMRPEEVTANRVLVRSMKGARLTTKGLMTTMEEVGMSQLYHSHSRSEKENFKTLLQQLSLIGKQPRNQGNTLYPSLIRLLKKVGMGPAYHHYDSATFENLTKFRKDSWQALAVRKWGQKHLVSKLLPLIHEEGLCPTRLIWYGAGRHLHNGDSTRNYNTHNGYPLVSYWSKNPMSYVPLFRRYIVLTHSRRDIHSRVEDLDEWVGGYSADDALIAYVVPRSMKKVEEARKALSTLKGWEVLDLTKEAEVIEYDSKTGAAPVVSKPRKKGYPMLSACHSSGIFSLEMARTESVARVENPSYYVRLPTKSDYYTRKCVRGLDKVCSAYLLKNFGDVGAVVYTETQEANMEKKGIKSARDFLLVKLLEEVEKPEFSKACSLRYTLLLDAAKEPEYVDLIRKMMQVEECRKVFKLPEPEDPAAEELLTTVYSMDSRFFTPEQKESLETLGKKIKAIPGDKQVLEMLKKISEAPLVALLNTSEVRRALGDKKTVTSAVKLLKTAIRG
ncbi:putative rIIA-like protein [Pseudomonas phage phiPA1-3]|nr:putative rIIA-like protein [Pseudomonas phage phiPA1-3]